MNPTFRFILFCFPIVLCYSCARYRLMTHLSDEELEWITNRYEGENMYFQSQAGMADTITIKEIKIENSIDSIDWNYYTTGGSGVYYAGGCIWFSLRDIPYFNRFSLYKDTTELIYFGANILKFLIPAVPLADTCMQIDNMIYEDVLVFDESSCEIINRLDLPNPITSIVWSKKYGLVQYTFMSGEVYNRVWSSE